MRPVYQTFSMAAADDDSICVSQTPGAAGALTLDGAMVQAMPDLTVFPASTRSAAVLDVPRHVGITSAGNDSGKTFTVVGLNRFGMPLTEAVTGANAGVVETRNNFSKVFRVSISAAAAGAVKVGTTAAADLPWIPMNRYRPKFQVGLQGTLSAGAGLTWGIQYTTDNIQADAFQEGDAAVFDHATLTGKTVNASGSLEQPVMAVRAKITSYSSGTFSLAVIQE